jgi:uncharacterized membrane protein
VRRIDPLIPAVAKPVGAISLLAVAPAIFWPWQDLASNLMYAIAQVGVAIVFAFVVEAVWLVERADRKAEDHRDFLGVTCGFGVAGLIGVALALAVGAHRDAGYSSFLDAYGLWWSVFSLVILGSLVVVQPLLADRHRAAEETGSATPSEPLSPAPTAE